MLVSETRISASSFVDLDTLDATIKKFAWLWDVIPVAIVNLDVIP